MTAPDLPDLHDLVRRLEALERRNAELEGRAPTRPVVSQVPDEPRPVSRRGLLGAAAGLGAVALTTWDAAPAAASTDEALVLGAPNTAEDTTRIDVDLGDGVGGGMVLTVKSTQTRLPQTALAASIASTEPDPRSSAVYGIVLSSSATGGAGVLGVHGGGAGGIGVSGYAMKGQGVAGGSDSNDGVAGVSNSGTGVRGTSTSGDGVVGLAGPGSGMRGTSTSGTGVLGESGSQYGVLGTSTSAAGVRGVSTSADGLQGTTSTTTSASAVHGLVRSGTGTGVYGDTLSTTALRGDSTSGLDLDCTGSGRIHQRLRTAVGAPTDGAHTSGEQVRDSTGALYLCIASGTPGTWARAAAVVPGYAGGASHVLPNSTRVLDTRAGQQAFSHPGASFAAGSSHDVQVAGLTFGGVTVPAGAAAVIGNVTVVSPSAAGYLTLWPKGASRPGTSNVNFSAGQTVANSVYVAVGTSNSLSVFTSATTDVILDVAGFVV